MDLKKVQQIINENKVHLNKYGIKSLAVFGSIARGQATSESDVDLLIEFLNEKTIDLFDFIELNQFLEEKFKCKVDLVTKKALKKQLSEQILREAIRVA